MNIIQNFPTLEFLICKIKERECQKKCGHSFFFFKKNKIKVYFFSNRNSIYLVILFGFCVHNTQMNEVTKVSLGKNNFIFPFLFSQYPTLIFNQNLLVVLIKSSNIQFHSIKYNFNFPGRKYLENNLCLNNEYETRLRISNIKSGQN